MKRPAIVCLFWDRFASAVEPFLALHPEAVVLSLRSYAGAHLIAQGEPLASRVVILEDLVDAARQAGVVANAGRILADIRSYLESFGWDDYARTLSDERQDIEDIQTTERKQRLSELVQETAQAYLPNIVRFLESLEAAAEQYELRALVTNEDITTIGKSAVLWAKSRRIPTLHLVHGITLAQAYTVHSEVFADVLAAFGPRTVESYLDVGLPRERMRLTGNPAWDALPALVARREEERRRLVEEHGLDPSLPIIIFGPSWAANLTARSDEFIFPRTLAPFVKSIAELREQGIAVNAVIKDRPHHFDFGQRQFLSIAAELGINPEEFVFVSDAPGPWLVAADIVVSVDSNLAVEAVLCGTLSVNLLNTSGLRIGPSFEAGSGIVEVDGEMLGDTLLRLLSDPRQGERLRAAMAESISRYQYGGLDGKAGERVAALISELYRQQGDHQGYVWQECLDVPDIAATEYHGGARGDLVEQFSNQPALLLDIGCAAGGTGAAFKEKYPHGKVWGIELNKSAAAIAARRLDKVLVGKFEEFDLEAEGLAKGSVDAVVIADVLEHMYNPWAVMVALKPYLSQKAQIMISIPNVRNLALMDDLSRGYFRYEPKGLLDITHIRFFTYKELLRFFHETGYHVTRNTFGIDTRLAGLYARYKDRVPCDLDTGKLVIKDVDAQELSELCSLQFYMMVEPGREQLIGYDPPGQFQQAPAQVYSQFLVDHQITMPEARMFERRMETWAERGPLPTVLIPIYTAKAYLPLLGGTIQALSDQLYYEVSLVVVSPEAPPEAFAGGERLSWHRSDAEPAAALQEVIAARPGDWILPLNAGDLLVPHALLQYLEAAFTHPEWQLIYADEDHRDPENGQLDKPFFKPDFNLDYFYSLPYLGDTAMISRRVWELTGGYRAQFGGMADYDLQLRILELAGPTGFGHVADVLIHRVPLRGTASEPTAQLVAAGQAALVEHFARLGKSDVKIRFGTLPGTYSVLPALPNASVSIILLAHNRQASLQRTLETLLEKTGNVAGEIIVIDAASDAETRDYLTQVDGLNNDTIRVFGADTIDGGIYRLLNQAAGAARGDFLLFLAADCVPLNEAWLETLLAHGARSDVAAVGGRLLDQGGRIVSAGRILGLGGTAESPFVNQRFDQPGYFGRLQCTQSLSALSEACLLVRRDDFLGKNGFDEAYRHRFGDIDLCLRLSEDSRHAVWTPEASLMHGGGDFSTLIEMSDADRSASLEADRNRLFDAWLPRLAHDPAFNRNLSFIDPDFVLETRPELTRIGLPWRPLPSLLAIPMDDSGCGNYRVVQPFGAAQTANLLTGWCRRGIFNPLDVARMNPDVIYVQRHVLDMYQAALKNYRRHFSAKIVFEVDDLMWAVPEKSVHRVDLPKNLKERLARSFEFCDRLIVTTPTLAAAYRELTDEIRVVPNGLDLSIWGALSGRRRQGKKPRVGWAGGSGHTGDLEILAPVVEALKDEVEWVFFGLTPNDDRTHIAEYHGGVPFHDYPQKLAALDLDLALAPLEFNLFNECKSNLRLLEYGILGYPVIATDIVTYQSDLPVTRVSNDPEAWIAAIRERIRDRDALAAEGDALREAVRTKWTTQGFLAQWMEAWFRF